MPDRPLSFADACFRKIGLGDSGRRNPMRKRQGTLSITHIFAPRVFEQEPALKSCHPERSPRSEGPRNTPQNVPLSIALSKQTSSFFKGEWMLAPSFHAFIGVAPVRLREVLRFEDCAQDDKPGAPFRLPSPAAKFVKSPTKTASRHDVVALSTSLRAMAYPCAGFPCTEGRLETARSRLFRHPMRGRFRP